MSGIDVLAVCDLGHEFLLKDFEPESQTIAAISWCPEMVSSPAHGGLILECGARVLWVKRLKTLDKSAKKRRFRSKQLDLFYDNPDFDQGLDKAKDV